MVNRETRHRVGKEVEKQKLDRQNSKRMENIKRKRQSEINENIMAKQRD